MKEHAQAKESTEHDASSQGRIVAICTLTARNGMDTNVPVDCAFGHHCWNYASKCRLKSKRKVTEMNEESIQ
jgi:hypothetical protein